MTQQQIADVAPQRNTPKAPAETPAVLAASGAPRSRRMLLILGVLGVLVVAFFVWRGFFASPGLPPGIVAVSGRIEGDDSAVAPKTAGRLLEGRVREGDQGKAGDIIAILDDDQIRAREEAARAALASAQANSKAAQAQVGVLQQQLQQNQLLTDQAKLDAQGRVRQAEADLAAAESELARQQAAYDLALFDKEAYTRLAQSG